MKKYILICIKIYHMTEYFSIHFDVKYSTNQHTIKWHVIKIVGICTLLISFLHLAFAKEKLFCKMMSISKK